MHAYVLPGSSPGESIVLFKALPETVSSLPDWSCSPGSETCGVQRAGGRAVAAKVSATTSTRRTSRSASKRRLPTTSLRSQAAEVGLVRRTTSPSTSRRRGTGIPWTAAYVKSLVEKLAFGLDRHRTLLGDCYEGVLTPYQYVTVRGVNSKLSGYYLITKVTHTLMPLVVRPVLHGAAQGAVGAVAGLAGLVASIF